MAVREAAAVVFEVAIDANKPAIKEAVETSLALRLSRGTRTITKRQNQAVSGGQLASARTSKGAMWTLEAATRLT